MNSSPSPAGEQIDGPLRERELTFFSLSTCGMCKKGREYLSEKGYAYTLVMVDQLDPDRKSRLKAELSRKFGKRVTFPALMIDDTSIVLGFFRASWEEALNGTANGV